MKKQTAKQFGIAAQNQRIQDILAKWQVVCDNCYRKQYCQFVLTTDNCILFRPKENTDVHNTTKQ